MTTDHGVHPHHDEPNDFRITKLKASFTHYLTVTMNDNESTFYLDRVSIAEADIFIDSMEFAAMALREWNDTRKAEENEELEA